MPSLLLSCAAARRRARRTRTQHNAPPDAWQWGVEGTVFAGYNYQYREFTDFDEFESQNWLMTVAGDDFAQRRFAPRVHRRCSRSSRSTLRDIGSPQVFQTGETFGGAPLIDYQHPHDLS